MKNKLIVLTAIVLFFLFAAIGVFAQERANNKFGIHLARPNEADIKAAAELVNSSGGDWGYVTLVMQDNEMDKEYWQNVFDLLRRYHLIPIIRLATHPSGNKWIRPKQEEAKKWVEFLDSLNWVVKKRYVVLFNEPNHGSEWGGRVDPEDYARVSLAFAKALKEKNSNFFVMLAGFDASAPQRPPYYMDEKTFLFRFMRVFGTDNFEKYVDGWASHSYPNPGFLASPKKRGRGSITTYDWELSLLRSLGVKKRLPVFITETGWDRSKVGEKKTAQYFRYAFEKVWLKDKRVVAVTPFLLSYFTHPFDKFSWQGKDGRFYKVYEVVKNIGKIKGKPEIEEKGAVSIVVGKRLVAYSTYTFQITLKNLGQAIWDEKYGYRLELEPQVEGIEVAFSPIKSIEPFSERVLFVHINTKGKVRKRRYRLVLKKEGKVILKTQPWEVEVLPSPSLEFYLSLFPKFNANDSDFEIQIFDKNEQLVFKKTHVKVVEGKGKVDNIQNVQIGEKYRAVILKPYYLPRQTIFRFESEKQKVRFKSLLPLDFDVDGNFDLRDLWFLIKKPSNIRFFLPM